MKVAGVTVGLPPSTRRGTSIARRTGIARDTDGAGCAAVGRTPLCTRFITSVAVFAEDGAKGVEEMPERFESELAIIDHHEILHPPSP